jgi:hypothetical protein
MRQGVGRKEFAKGAKAAKLAQPLRCYANAVCEVFSLIALLSRQLSYLPHPLLLQVMLLVAKPFKRKYCPA